MRACGPRAGVAPEKNNLVAQLASGQACFSIHTSTFVGGAVRAFVTAVPEPQTDALLLVGQGLLRVVATRRQQAVAA
jgi:ABC-type amino acid transport system permease subunit